MRIKCLAVLLLAVALVLCACDSLDNKSTDTSISATEKVRVTGELLISDDDDDDISGYPVTINETLVKSSPAKVICLSSSLTEMIYELGFGDRLIGRGSYCEYPEEVLSLKDYGKPSSPELNDVRNASPDLLITATSIPSKDTSALSELGIQVLYIPSPRSVEEYGNIYRALGMVFEGQFAGEETGNKTFSAIRSELTGSGIDLGRFIYVTEGGAVAGGDTFESSVLSLFGENIAVSASGYTFDKSLLADDQPDTIVFNSDVPVSELKSDTALSFLDAVVSGKMISVSNSYFESPSGRITGLLAELAGEKEDENEA
ncbi:MAG: ABC transporter substrate-binding protein [Ruminiclostridium sp.]|nr:ABC transporter substrate-binding protein [Ruminiclostridium sp.]